MSQSKANPTLIERIRDSWVHYSHLAYVTIFLGGAMFASAPEKAEWAQKVSLIAIASYFVVLLIFFLWFVHAYSRKARYAEALRLVHSAIHDIRDIASYLERSYRKKDRYVKSVVKESLQRCLDAVAMSFALVTGARCRVCIKVVGGSDPANAYVTTACRDKISAGDCRVRDTHENQTHLISKNTDFNYIINGGKTFYINNDVAGTHGYMNTSDDFYRSKLPYSAAIVLPIRRTFNVSSLNDAPNQPQVVGFLCIDSDSRFSFSEKYDVQMGAIIADALCPIIELWDRLERMSRRSSI